MHKINKKGAKAPKNHQNRPARHHIQRPPLKMYTVPQSIRAPKIVQKQPKDNQCKRFVLRPHLLYALATH